MHSTILRTLCVLVVATVCGGEEVWECEPVPCKCIWVSGKRTADCIAQNLTMIPDFLGSTVQHFELGGNHIKQLQKETFSKKGLVNLHKILLQRCGITTVHREAFNGLLLLIEIDLTDNHIVTLHVGTFLETLRLRTLILNYNEIDRFEDNLFYNLTHLQKVEVANNKLERIGNTTFSNLPKLKDIDLGGNRLTNLMRESFNGSTNLVNIRLVQNSWNCDCHLKDFRDWSSKNCSLVSKETTCAQPPNLAGKMWGDIKSDFACPPEIIAIGIGRRGEVNPGDVTLTCKVSGNPFPEVGWLYKNKPANNVTRRYNGEANGYVLAKGEDWLNLTIPNASPADKGEYVCVAKSVGGTVVKNVSLNVTGDVIGTNESSISLPLALGLGLTALLLLVLLTLVLCACYCRRRRSRRDEKTSEVNALEHHGLGEQEKSLITAINPVVKPPRRYEAAPSVTSHGTETTELNRTLLDNDSVFAGGVGDDDRERSTPELEGGTLPRGTNYRQYPPDLLAFSGGRGASPTSQASTAPDSSRLPSQSANFSPTNNANPYPPGFKTLPHNRSAAPYSAGPPVLPRHGYITIPRRPRAPSWSSAPPASPDGLEPVYDNLGLRTTADGSSVLSLNKSPEPSVMRGRPLPGTPTSSHYHPSIQRSTPNMLTTSPTDRSAPEGAPEWPGKLSDEMDVPFLGGTLGRKVPPRPPPKPKQKTANGPLYEDEGEDGTEV